MREKLTAKHPRPTSTSRAPVRSGSATARKTTRPAAALAAALKVSGGPKPAAPKRAAGAGTPRAGAGRPSSGDDKPRAPRAGAGRPFSGDDKPRAPRAGAGRPFSGDDKPRSPRSGAGRPFSGDDKPRAPRAGAGRPFSGDDKPRTPRAGAGRPFSGDDKPRSPRSGAGRPFSGDDKPRAPRAGAGRPFAGDDRPRTPRAGAGRPFSGDDRPRTPRAGAGRPFSGDDRPRTPRAGAGRPFSGDDKPRTPRAGAGRPFSGDDKPRTPRAGAGRPFSGDDKPRTPRAGAGRPFSGDDKPRAPRAGAGRPFSGDDKPRAPRAGADRPFSRDDKPRSPRSGSTDTRTSRFSAERSDTRTARPPRARDDAYEAGRAPRARRDEGTTRLAKFGDAPRGPRTGDRAERSGTDTPARGFAKPVKRSYADAPAPAPRAKRDFAGTDAARRPAPQPEKRHAAYRDDNEEGLMRLSKRMSELGLCSRREADEWIEQGWVLVDGVRIDTLGTKVHPDQRIEIDDSARAAQAAQVTILLNKPVGYVSGQAEDGYEPAVTLITRENHWSGDHSPLRFSPKHLRTLAPAGRLDIDSTGLLVLTQNGRIAKQLIGEHSDVDKEYLVRVRYGDIETDIEPHFPPESLALLRHGLSLDGVPLKTAQVSWQNGEQLRFVLREGKKRQIRRMCELVGLEVIGLKRIRMGHVTLGALPQGEWRYLGPDESF